MTAVRGRAAVACLLAACAAVAAGCAGTAPPSPQTPPPGTPAALDVTVAGQFERIGVLPGEPVTLLVRARDAAGRPVPAPGRPAFVVRAPDVVAVDSAGVVTGLAEGDGWVVASVASGGRVLADSVEILVRCTAELRTRFVPFDTTLHVGESFTPTLTLSTCGGRVAVHDTLVWRAADPRVVRVDPATGRTMAIAPGRTWLEAVGRRGAVYEATRVTVLAPPP